MNPFVDIIYISWTVHKLTSDVIYIKNLDTIKLIIIPS